MHRFASHVAVALLAAGCTKGADSSSRSGSVSAVDSDAVAGARTDLSAKGLPITIVLPTCADGSAPTIKGPMVKLADNAADQIIACEISEKDAMDGKPVFAIQVGLSKGKLEKKDVKEDLNFVRFTSDDPKSLEWESKMFDQRRREFLLRVSAGGSEYACFPQFGTSDDALYQAEITACRSIAPK